MTKYPSLGLQVVRHWFSVVVWKVLTKHKWCYVILGLWIVSEQQNQSFSNVFLTKELFYFFENHSCSCRRRQTELASVQGSPHMPESRQMPGATISSMSVAGTRGLGPSSNASTGMLAGSWVCGAASIWTSTHLGCWLLRWSCPWFWWSIVGLRMVACWNQPKLYAYAVTLTWKKLWVFSYKVHTSRTVLTPDNKACPEWSICRRKQRSPYSPKQFSFPAIIILFDNCFPF